MAVRIKTMETIQHKFPTKVLMLFQDRFRVISIFCFISAANYPNVITIVRETEELGSKVFVFISVSMVHLI